MCKGTGAEEGNAAQEPGQIAAVGLQGSQMVHPGGVPRWEAGSPHCGRHACPRVAALGGLGRQTCPRTVLEARSQQDPAPS